MKVSGNLKVPPESNGQVHSHKENINLRNVSVQEGVREPGDFSGINEYWGWDGCWIILFQ